MAKRISAVFLCAHKDKEYCGVVMNLLKDIQEMSDDERLIDFLIETLRNYKIKNN